MDEKTLLAVASLLTFAQEYGGELGVDDDCEVVEAFLAKKGLKVPVTCECDEDAIAQVETIAEQEARWGEQKTA